jgi:imidazoleglycerol-phosphate dehydratase
MSARRANVVRTTDQTEVKIVFDLEGSGSGIVQTGVPILDHLLALFARHGVFDLEVQCRFDEARPNALMEEVGFCLGFALDKALGDKQGILRLGHCCAPVEDHLARAVVEITGHPCLVYHVRAQASPLGGPDSVEVEKFWRAFVAQARLNLHIELLYGVGGLPALEAIFKAAAHALSDACRIQSRLQGLPNPHQKA